jgi:sec-independent protein translocase protein TatC
LAPKKARKAASFEDRMTLVEHLDELRSRIIFSGISLLVVAALCFVFNHQLLSLANGPLPDDQQLLTLSPSEPFITTLTLVFYSAILITLPILLYQAYAFILPALSPNEKKTMLPMLLMIPFLFVAGVIFAYFIVFPAALKFLLNFNSDQFNIQIRAKDYYSFFSLTLVSMGMLFQVPVGILAVTRLGIVTPQQLAKNRRYAILIIAIVAMLLPGTDPVTMLLSMLPLLLLFEGSLILARMLGTPGAEKDLDEAVEEEADDVKADAADAKDDVKKAVGSDDDDDDDTGPPPTPNI